MDKARLEEIKNESQSVLNVQTDFEWSQTYVNMRAKETLELVAEVERLQGRLEAVCAIMTDPNAFYGEEVTVKVMEAVRGE